MSDEKALRLYEDSAVGAIELKTVTQVVDVLRATLDGGSEMPKEVLGAIAFDSMLTGTMPGREIHYFYYKDKKSGKMKLGKSDDFKLLIRWANEKEQMMTGDPSATFKDSYRNLTDEERATEKVAANDTAVFCTIISDRDMASVKGWRDAGASFQEAIDLVGTTAIGVVKANDTKIPTGWSAGQKARKLAQKACIRARYGQPSMDELAAMRRRWAKVATEDDWAEVPANLPLEAQARLANLTAVGREVREGAAERAATMTPKERKEALEERVNLLRGEVEEVGIGDEPERESQLANWSNKTAREKAEQVLDEFKANTGKTNDLEAELQAETDLLRSPEADEAGIWEDEPPPAHLDPRRQAKGQEKEQETTAEELAEDVARINELEAFASEVISKIPYFQDRKEVYDAMYHITGQAPEDWPLDDTHLADLDNYASNQADARTEGEVEQDKLFS